MAETAAAAPKPATAPPRPASRMSLAGITRGRIEAPIRALIYGPEGVGKSTWAAGAPRPVFLGAEDGTATLDVARLPQPRTFQEVREAVQLLAREEHDFGSLVLDSADWIEPLVWAEVVARGRDGEKTIEDFGYGKGYVAALDLWRLLLADLEQLRALKKMHVIIIGHAWVKAFKNPAGEDYDRTELKLHTKAAGLLKEWCDVVLFAAWETYARVDPRTKRVKGVSTGARLLYSERCAAFDAKSRYPIPPELPLSWADFYAATQARQVAPPADLVAEVKRKAAELGGETEAKVLAALAKAGADAVALAELNNKVNARLSQQSTTSSTTTQPKET